MIIDRNTSCLLLVDVQEKLTPFVIHHDALVARCDWLMRLATAMQVPLLVSEQYPQGLGKTVAALQSFSEVEDCIEKVHFSCFREPMFFQRLQALQKKQLIIAGIETHVCVLQSALELNQAGFEVFVVVDAVSSRSEFDHRFGLKRMKSNGIHLVTSEMVFFEWVRVAGTPEFKALSQRFLPRAKAKE